MRKIQDYILLYFKGMGMGAADVVPGVSGGTIAFITGIYEELLASLKAIDLEAFRLLFRFRIKELWQKVNGNFLVALLAGIATSILTLAKMVTYLLEHQPILIWSFFFGLILISAPLVLREIKKWNIATGFACLAGVAIAYSITVVSPTQTPTELWFTYFCGALAICAMILPGISGAFILLLLGKYEFMINALVDLNIAVVIVFVLGCISGLLLFSRALSWILEKYHSLTVALLAGFMVGSLNKVWPWREVLEFATNSKGEQVPAFDRSILPGDYLSLTGKDPMVFKAILLMALGVFIVIAIERFAARLKTKR